MFKTISIIVVMVTIFGVGFFFIVKRALKKRLDFYLSKNNKKKFETFHNYIILDNFLNSSFGISKTFFEIS